MNSLKWIPGPTPESRDGLYWLQDTKGKVLYVFYRPGDAELYYNIVAHCPIPRPEGWMVVEDCGGSSEVSYEYRVSVNMLSRKGEIYPYSRTSYDLEGCQDQARMIRENGEKGVKLERRKIVSGTWSEIAI